MEQDNPKLKTGILKYLFYIDTRNYFTPTQPSTITYRGSALTKVGAILSGPTIERYLIEKKIELDQPDRVPNICRSTHPKIYAAAVELAEAGLIYPIKVGRGIALKITEKGIDRLLSDNEIERDGQLDKLRAFIQSYPPPDIDLNGLKQAVDAIRSGRSQTEMHQTRKGDDPERRQAVRLCDVRTALGNALGTEDPKIATILQALKKQIIRLNTGTGPGLGGYG